MTNCPDLSAIARSCTSPSRSSSTVAPGAARPATTVSPGGSMLTTSNVGTPSPLSGGGCDPIRALATAFASDFAVASGAAIRSCASDPGLGIAGAAVGRNDRQRGYDYSGNRYGSHDTHPPAGALTYRDSIPSRAGRVRIRVR